jgi:predicted nuclease of predicted toxin-antitoxin system
MRLLADENFSGPIVESLRSAGNDVLWARSHCQGWSDTALLDLAESEGRILLTLDKESAPQARTQFGTLLAKLRRSVRTSPRRSGPVW